MSNSDSGSKTEPATPRKLRQARERGQVAVLLALLGVGMIWAEGAYVQLQEMMHLATRPLPAYEHRMGDLVERTWGIFSHGLLCVAPFVATLTVAALISGTQQTGMLLAPKALAPDYERSAASSASSRKSRSSTSARQCSSLRC